MVQGHFPPRAVFILMPKLPILFVVIVISSPDPKLVKIIGIAKISLVYGQYSFKGNWTSVSNTKKLMKIAW